MANNAHLESDTAVQANAENQYEVTYDDLPLSCPMPNMTLWNSHPRVYLPIEKTGQAKCGYCGAEFKLKDFDPHKEKDHWF